MKKSRKEFIIEAHKAACEEWKLKIEKEFPKLFKEGSLEAGKWYKTKKIIYFVTTEIMMDMETH